MRNFGPFEILKNSSRFCGCWRDLLLRKCFQKGNRVLQVSRMHCILGSISSKKPFLINSVEIWPIFVFKIFNAKFNSRSNNVWKNAELLPVTGRSGSNQEFQPYNQTRLRHVRSRKTDTVRFFPYSQETFDNMSKKITTKRSQIKLDQGWTIVPGMAGHKIWIETENEQDRDTNLTAGPTFRDKNLAPSWFFQYQPFYRNIAIIRKNLIFSVKLAIHW